MDSKKIKLTHIITGLNIGGAEMMLLKLTQKMNKNLFEIKIICLSGKGPLNQEFEKIGIEVNNCNITFLRSLSGLISLYKFLKKASPDIVHTWLYHSDFLGGIFAFFMGIKNIVWNIRGSYIGFRLNKLHTFLIIYINSLLSNYIPKAIISNSFECINIFSSIGYKSDIFKFIPNGFDTQKFSPNKIFRNSIRKEIQIPDKSKLIGYIARFDVQKNHFGFIKIASIIKSKMPDVYFALAGKGIDYKNTVLLDWLDKFNLRSSFRLLGSRNDINKINSALDLYLSPSYGEGFPNSIGEAMSCGVPCIATNVGDCKQIIDNEELISEVDDTEDLINKTLVALNWNNEEFYKQSFLVRKRIKELYSLENVKDKYEEFYKSLIKKDYSYFKKHKL